jgi:hypothetical protein
MCGSMPGMTTLGSQLLRILRTRTGIGSGSPLDHRGRLNNRRLLARRRGFSEGDRREVLRAFRTAIVGIFLIAAAAVAMAALVTDLTKRPVAFDEAGPVLDLASSRTGVDGGGPRSTAAPID